MHASTGGSSPIGSWKKASSPSRNGSQRFGGGYGPSSGSDVGCCSIKRVPARPLSRIYCEGMLARRGMGLKKKKKKNGKRSEVLILGMWCWGENKKAMGKQLIIFSTLDTQTQSCRQKMGIDASAANVPDMQVPPERKKHWKVTHAFFFPLCFGFWWMLNHPIDPSGRRAFFFLWSIPISQIADDRRVRTSHDW